MQKNLIKNYLSEAEKQAYKTQSAQWSIVYPTILVDLLVAWAMLLIGFIPFVLLRDNPVGSLVLVLPMALYLSFWKQSYITFFHEAAHFNIHHNRKINDRLANLFLTPFIGLWIKSYRRHHWQHHVHLGTDGDTEISYVTSLNAKNIIASITGVYLAKTVFRYFTVAKDKTGRGTSTESSIKFVSGLCVLAVSQLAITAVLYVTISIYAAACWLITVFITDMFLANMRQTLEHRDARYGDKDDFSDSPHGEVNQMFGTDLLSRHMGGAGFNRHLLHHLDPTVSYTRFDEMEAYLSHTGAASYIDDNRTSYAKRIRELVSI